MATVKLTNVKKIYDNKVVAVQEFNLDIADKEFVVFVGPSGCGKSTTLRMIAGLEEISEGTVEIDGEVVNDLQPKDRNIAMVFQNYALYPHLTVFENMAFPLRLDKTPRISYPSGDGKELLLKEVEKLTKKIEENKENGKTGSNKKLQARIDEIKDTIANGKEIKGYSNDEIYERVTNAAEILGITQYLTRKPRALSGGQRQRVAIGRAMVRDSKVFLMDEPLSNLDAKLRNQMRSEIILLRKKIDTTFVYVTHDQTEAMTLGDRIVIMKDGFIMQIGTPDEVFDMPSNLFVAEFIGAPKMNTFNAKLEKDGNDYYVNAFGARIKVTGEKALGLLNHNVESKEIILGVRPEHIVLRNEKASDTITCELLVNEMMGSELHLHARTTEGSELIVRIPTIQLTREERDGLVAGKMLNLSFEGKVMHFFDKETDRNILVDKHYEYSSHEVEELATESSKQEVPEKN